MKITVDYEDERPATVVDYLDGPFDLMKVKKLIEDCVEGILAS